MEKIINKLLTLGIMAVFMVFVYTIYNKPDTASASAPTGLMSSVATTSQPTVGTTAISVFATSTSCNARIISTYASPVMITFSDFKGETPTGVFGFLQAASTTQAYDSGIYGCGLLKIYSFTSQTITVTETR